MNTPSLPYPSGDEPRIIIVKKSELLSRDGGDDAINSHMEIVAERYPDFAFRGEWRRFAFLYDSDSIIHRIEATSTLITRPERARLQKVEAVIVEIGSDDPPIKFDDCSEGCRAWRELHHSFGVPLDDGFERELLSIWAPDGDDDED